MPQSHNLSALYQHALSQQTSGHLDKAIATYRKLLRLKPDFIEALCNLGAVLHTVKDYTGAAECYRNVLKINPRLPQLHYNLGAALHAMGDAEAALGSYAQAVRLRPDYLEAHFNCGLLEMERGLYFQSLEHLGRALSVNPDVAEVYNCIGLCLKRLGRHGDAIANLKKAVQITPAYFEALNNLAVELMADGQFEAAVECSKQALVLRPAEGRAHYNFGNALKACKRFSEAISSFRKALELDPGMQPARLDLAHTLQTVCDWRDPDYSLQGTAQHIERILKQGIDIDIDLFNALSLPLTGSSLLQLARRYSDGILDRARGIAPVQTAFKISKQDRLRIGYLSPKYHNHPGAHLMGGLFNAHDRSRVEVFAYSLGRDDGSIYRRRIEREAEHFVDLRAMSLQECVERIRADDIHILVDLAGYSTDARPEIFALRVAPVQVNYLGFPGTLGADYYDYIITDRIITPPEEQAAFAETFAYLPYCYQINDDRYGPAEQPPPRSSCELPEGAFVFCCFNNNYKIDALVFDAWMRILKSVPGSVLWLLRGSKEQTDNLRREARAHGLAATRLVFAEPLPKPQHLARHCHADLFLDTLHYNAHTTGSDALRMGVPMLTVRGQTFASRVGASLLTAVDLDDLIMNGLDSYIATAVDLAVNPSRLTAVRKRLSDGLLHTSLLDNPRFAADLEHLYEAMWTNYLSGKCDQIAL